MNRRFPLAILALALTSVAHAQIPLSEYAERRAALARAVGDGVLVARGAEEPVVDYESFHQTPNFYYLTGYREAGAALLMHKRGADVRWTLYVQDKDPAQEVWSGQRNGPQRASTMTGIPARSITEFEAALDSALRQGRAVHFVAAIAESGDTLNKDDDFLRALQARHSGKSLDVKSANGILTRMRGTKSATELDLLRRAAAISADAHREAAQTLEPGMNEFEIQALLEYTFRRNGGDRPAYASIVGSGPNATTLHYNRDDRFMVAGDLLLIDAGTSYGGYAADVTRTFPVSGTFTREQREIYQIVRDAQAAAERLLKAGVPFRELNNAARSVIAAGLAKLRLIDAPEATYDCEQQGMTTKCSQVSLYYMHGLGHGIGLEVHDPDQYYFTGNVGPGSAFTIEPGIYVRENLLEILPKTDGNRALVARIRDAVNRYRNIGVRIEDDYLVTKDGVQRVSCVPREIDEVEAMMRGDPMPDARNAQRVDWYKSVGAPPSEANRAGTPLPQPAACDVTRI